MSGPELIEQACGACHRGTARYYCRRCTRRVCFGCWHPPGPTTTGRCTSCFLDRMRKEEEMAARISKRDAAIYRMERALREAGLDPMPLVYEFRCREIAPKHLEVFADVLEHALWPIADRRRRQVTCGTCKEERIPCKCETTFPSGSIV